MGEGKDHGKDEDGQENSCREKQVSQSKSSGTHLLGMLPIANTQYLPKFTY